MTVETQSKLLFFMGVGVGELREEIKEMKKPKVTWNLAKYFVHGIAFSILFILLAFAWVFIMILLVSLGSIIGLVIGIGLLFLIVGFINMVLGVHLWNIEAETGFWRVFFHGLVLFIILLIANLVTSILPNLAFPGTATLVVTFIITSFLDGVIGKNVASWFGHEIVEKGEMRNEIV